MVGQVPWSVSPAGAPVECISAAIFQCGFIKGCLCSICVSNCIADPFVSCLALSLSLLVPLQAAFEHIVQERMKFGLS